MKNRLFVRLAEDPTQGPESGAPAASLRALPVLPWLAPFVAHALSYRETFAPGEELVERVLPDGAVRVILQAGPAPVALVVGPSARAKEVRLRGAVEGVSLTLRPGAAAALLGVPAGDVTDSAVRLEDLWPRDGARLLARLADAHDNAARALLVQHALARRVQAKVPDPVRSAAAALQFIEAARGRCRARDVAAAMGTGERRMQQLFHQHVGLAPKAMARLARLHAVLRALRRPAPPSMATLALEHGFFDQAHLANEFRALSGFTPMQILARTRAG